MKTVIRRIGTTAAALLLATGASLTVTTTATAQTPSADASSALPPEMQDSVGTAVTGSVALSAAPLVVGYYFVWCPFFASDEERASGHCTF